MQFYKIKVVGTRYFLRYGNFKLSEVLEPDASQYASLENARLVCEIANRHGFSVLIAQVRI